MVTATAIVYNSIMAYIFNQNIFQTMKYYKTIKELTIEGKLGKLTLILSNTFLRKVDDRNDRYAYLTSDGIEISEVTIKANPEFFVEISKIEYDTNHYDYNEIANRIREIAKETGLSELQVITNIDKELGIIRLDQWVNPWPAAPWPTTQPYIQPYDYPNIRCTSCGKLPGEACFSTACPNRLNIIYCTTKSNEKG